MRFDVLTLFPEMFAGYLSESILKLAQQRGLVQVHTWNIRDWATGKHKSVDDRPFGGGPGMVMMPGPVFDCVEAVRAMTEPPGELVMLTPAGERLTQRVVEELGTYDPQVPDNDKNVTLRADRIKYWQSVGAKSSHKVSVLLNKFLARFEGQAAAPPAEGTPKA